MIIRCKSGGQVVIGECSWVPGVYVSLGNMRGSQGAIIDPEALDQVRAELDRIAAAIADRAAAKHRKKEKAA